MQDLFGLSARDLLPVAESLSLRPFAAKQIARWIYARRAVSFDEMTDLPKAARERLEGGFLHRTPGSPSRRASPPTGRRSTSSGPRAASPAMARPSLQASPRFVEAAYIPEPDRRTLCVSTQVGCKMGCLFCMTGKQGFQSHLSAGGILAQVRGIPESESLTNVVYMGMGEPLDNLESVLKSLEILTADWGFGFSNQRVTLSSVGLMPALEEFFRRSKVRFALSLHSPFEEERRSLMPVQNVARPGPSARLPQGGAEGRRAQDQHRVHPLRGRQRRPAPPPRARAHPSGAQDSRQPHPLPSHPRLVRCAAARTRSWRSSRSPSSRRASPPRCGAPAARTSRPHVASCRRRNCSRRRRSRIRTTERPSIEGRRIGVSSDPWA